MGRSKREINRSVDTLSSDRIREILQRDRRAVKRSEKRKTYEGYTKRKWATDKVCRYIIFPVTLAATGKPNDFYLHALSLCWNNKNITKDYRCQQLLRGLRLQTGIPDLRNLKRSSETGWFLSSRKNDLARIGQLAGYFLHKYACSVGQIFDGKYDAHTQNNINDGDLHNLIAELKDGRTVVPVIVKLELSAESYFNASKFVTLDEYQVNSFTTGEEIVVTNRVKLLKITMEYENLAWSLLNSTSLESREQLVQDTPSLMRFHFTDNSEDEDPILSVAHPNVQVVYDDSNCTDRAIDENGSPCPLVSVENTKSKSPPNDKIQIRTYSSRVKKHNKKYSSEAFVLY